MTTGSYRFHVNSADKALIITIVVHGLVGIVLTLITEVGLHVDYGTLTPIVSGLLSVLSATLTQYAQGQPCPTAQPVTTLQQPETPQA